MFKVITAVLIGLAAVFGAGCTTKPKPPPTIEHCTDTLNLTPEVVDYLRTLRGFGLMNNCSEVGAEMRKGVDYCWSADAGRADMNARITASPYAARWHTALNQLCASLPPESPI